LKGLSAGIKGGAKISILWVTPLWSGEWRLPLKNHRLAVLGRRSKFDSCRSNGWSMEVTGVERLWALWSHLVGFGVGSTP